MPTRFRFSLRALLLFVLLTAVAVVSTQWYLRIRNSRPIYVAVESFNNQHMERYDQVVGDGRPPLTPEQVIAYLNSDEEIITQAPPRVAAFFRRIVRTKRIPNSVEFDFIPLTTSNKPGVAAWLVGMEIMDENARYRINIRKIDN